MLWCVFEPTFAFARQKVDYDKPYSEIREQISSFDSRHSLMPLEESSDAKSKTKDLDDDVVENRKTGEENINNDIDKEKKNENEKPVVLKKPKKITEDEDFRTIVVNGGAGALSEPVLGEVLKPNMQFNAVTGEWIKNNSVPEKVGNENISNDYREPKIVSPVINERVDSMVSKPLFGGKDKSWVQDVIREARERANVESVNSKTTAVVKSSEGVKNIVNKGEDEELLIEIAPAVDKAVAVKNIIPLLNVGGDETRVHVASYKNEGTANDGVRVLRAKYPIALDLPAVVQYEDTGKGWYYRLYFTGERILLERLCKEMNARGDWCKIQ